MCSLPWLRSSFENPHFEIGVLSEDSSTFSSDIFFDLHFFRQGVLTLGEQVLEDFTDQNTTCTKFCMPGPVPTLQNFDRDIPIVIAPINTRIVINGVGNREPFLYNTLGVGKTRQEKKSTGTTSETVKKRSSQDEISSKGSRSRKGISLR